MTFSYPAVFKKEKGVITATFPDLAGIEVTGTTMDETIRLAREAANEWITAELEEDDPQMPAITDIEDLTLKRNEEARMIMIYYRFFDGWDE